MKPTLAIISDKVQKLKCYVYTMSLYSTGHYVGYDILNVDSHTMDGESLDCDLLLEEKLKQKYGDIKIEYSTSV